MEKAHEKGRRSGIAFSLLSGFFAGVEAGR